jgi:glyoxylase-like metal-dependent hydrolase (beta-lactamase superfamily II)
MKAWTLAWNVAEVHVGNARTHILQVRRTGKGCLSYLAGSGDEVAVIDASLPSAVYLNLAREHGWRIRYVLETHIHADHLSRGRQLAAEAAATLLLPEQRRVRFPHSSLGHGDRITVGHAALVAHRTPGHTSESTSYVLNDHAVFTGDTLFTQGVGRPDLHADNAAARGRARELFRSLSALRALRPSIVVLPGHASVPIPFDGKPVAAPIRDVDQWLSTWLSSEEEFIDRVLSRLPPTPPNFTSIVELNERGELPADDTSNLEAGANRCAVA